MNSKEVTAIISQTLREVGLSRQQISQHQAFASWGRNRVMMYRRRGIVNPVKQNGRIYYSLTELQVAAKTNML